MQIIRYGGSVEPAINATSTAIEELAELKKTLSDQWNLPKSNADKLKHRTSKKPFESKKPEGEVRDYSVIREAQRKIKEIKGSL